MTNTPLTPTITAYFDHMGRATPCGAIHLFTTDATVIDDGHTYEGRSRVLNWLDGPASEFSTTSTPLSARSSGNTTVVVVLLRGNFPGGQVELTHTFTHEPDGRLSKLTIEPHRG